MASVYLSPLLKSLGKVQGVAFWVFVVLLFKLICCAQD